MIKHIVMWSLTDKEAAAENGFLIKQQLEALVGVVPGLLAVEVGLDFAGCDVALTATLADKQALAVYADHPAHCTVKTFINSVTASRMVCDYEV